MPAARAGWAPPQLDFSMSRRDTRAGVTAGKNDSGGAVYKGRLGRRGMDHTTDNRTKY